MICFLQPNCLIERLALLSCKSIYIKYSEQRLKLPATLKNPVFGFFDFHFFCASREKCRCLLTGIWFKESNSNKDLTGWWGRGWNRRSAHFRVWKSKIFGWRVQRRLKTIHRRIWNHSLESCYICDNDIFASLSREFSDDCPHKYNCEGIIASIRDIPSCRKLAADLVLPKSAVIKRAAQHWVFR